MTRPEVSVLLTSWNTADDTRRCLASLRETAGDVDYEVIAVDNASSDGSVDLLVADSRVRLIRNPENRGFAAAVNQAYRAAEGELLLILNSDVVLHPGALETMIGFLRRRPDAAGVSPLYLNPDGTFQQHYIQIPTFAACLALWTPLKRLPGFRSALARFRRDGEDFSQERELSSASCILARAEIFDPARIFDERFPIFWNDALLSQQLRAAGHVLWMTPDAVVTHARGASCVRLGPAMNFRHLMGGLVLFLAETRSSAHVVVFKTVMIADHLLKSALGRVTMLGWHDLRSALRGDVGPLPSGDTRPWHVVIGDEAWGDPVPPDRRVARVRIGPVARGSGRLRANETAPATWEITIAPLVGPFAHGGVVERISQRLAAVRLRGWLDRQSGARTLTTDRAHTDFGRWLGEDLPLTVSRTDG